MSPSTPKEQKEMNQQSGVSIAPSFVFQQTSPQLGVSIAPGYETPQQKGLMSFLSRIKWIPIKKEEKKEEKPVTELEQKVVKFNEEVKKWEQRSRELETQKAGLEQQIKEFNKKAEELEKGIKSWEQKGKEIETSLKQTSPFSPQYKELLKQYDTWREEGKALQQKASNLEKEYTALLGSVNLYNIKASFWEKWGRDLQEKYGELKREVDEYNTQQIKQLLERPHKIYGWFQEVFGVKKEDIWKEGIAYDVKQVKNVWWDIGNVKFGEARVEYVPSSSTLRQMIPTKQTYVPPEFSPSFSFLASQAGEEKAHEIWGVWKSGGSYIERPEILKPESGELFINVPPILEKTGITLATSAALGFVGGTVSSYLPAGLKTSISIAGTGAGIYMAWESIKKEIENYGFPILTPIYLTAGAIGGYYGWKMATRLLQPSVPKIKYEVELEIARRGWRFTWGDKDYAYSISEVKPEYIKLTFEKPPIITEEGGRAAIQYERGFIFPSENLRSNLPFHLLPESLRAYTLEEQVYLRQFMKEHLTTPLIWKESTMGIRGAGLPSLEGITYLSGADYSGRFIYLPQKDIFILSRYQYYPVSPPSYVSAMGIYPAESGGVYHGLLLSYKPAFQPSQVTPKLKDFIVSYDTGSSAILTSPTWIAYKEFVQIFPVGEIKFPMGFRGGGIHTPWEITEGTGGGLLASLKSAGGNLLTSLKGAFSKIASMLHIKKQSGIEETPTHVIIRKPPEAHVRVSEIHTEQAIRPAPLTLLSPPIGYPQISSFISQTMISPATEQSRIPSFTEGPLKIIEPRINSQIINAELKKIITPSSITLKGYGVSFINERLKQSNLPQVKLKEEQIEKVGEIMGLKSLQKLTEPQPARQESPHISIPSKPRILLHPLLQEKQVSPPLLKPPDLGRKFQSEISKSIKVNKVKSIRPQTFYKPSVYALAFTFRVKKPKLYIKEIFRPLLK